MRTTWWKSGDWNGICDVCGFKFKASELKLRWDGLRVCSGDWERRHPQDLIRPIPDQMPIPWTRPDVTPEFWILQGSCNYITSQGAADIGIADCARADINFGLTS